MSAISVFSSVDHISTPFNGVLLDAYGVFWGGGAVGPLPGATESMERLTAAGKVVGILSNTTQIGTKEIDKLRANGIFEGTHFHFIITSGDVAQKVFREEILPFEAPKKKYWLSGDQHPRFSSHEQIFQDTPYTVAKKIEDADFIYVSIPHIGGEDQTDLDIFRENAERMAQSGLPMVCANPDLYAHEGSPPKLVVRQGSIAALHEELGGEVFYVGKPSRLMFEAAMEKFAKYRITSPKDVLMVGDTPETDIRGARQFGMSAALVTKTGVFAERALRPGLEEALSRLAEGDNPDFLITTL